ncbi:MAG: LssY C-terminal domain-containing protein [Propionibacteriaceae bacterium]|nr:LssY C-terminal domain-containing protein [Propionibacteriaceae bacterium]
MTHRYHIPRTVPIYDSEPVKVRPGRRLPFYAVVDTVFIVIGIVFALWFAGLLLAQGLRVSWTHWLYLLPFWVVLAYLGLPRLHQFFTLLYVPNYFIGRTRTGDGLLGDPVNLALDGTEEDIHAAMQRAGWTLAEEVTLRSGWAMVVSSVLHRSYPEAPVSDLYLFGERHSFAYQQEVGGNPHQRHHVRFWKVPEGWVLPGGHRAGWLAAGTYDRSVGLSAFTFQITHKIDAETDRERDYIVNTVRYADPQVGVRVIKEFSSSYHHRNGGGDLIRTDGDLPILDVAGAYARRPEATLLPAEQPKRSHAFPPVSLLIAVLMVILSGALALFEVLAFLSSDNLAALEQEEQQVFRAVLLGSGAVIGVVMAVLIVLVLMRRRWAKIILLTLTTFESLSLLLNTSLFARLGWQRMASIAVVVMILLALTSETVRAWVARPNTRRLKH